MKLVLVFNHFCSCELPTTIPNKILWIVTFQTTQHGWRNLTNMAISRVTGWLTSRSSRTGASRRKRPANTDSWTAPTTEPRSRFHLISTRMIPTMHRSSSSLPISKRKSDELFSSLLSQIKMQNQYNVKLLNLNNNVNLCLESISKDYLSYVI